MSRSLLFVQYLVLTLFVLVNPAWGQVPAPPSRNPDVDWGGVAPEETNQAVLDALNPVLPVSAPLTHSGTTQAADEAAEFFTQKSQASRSEARSLFKGSNKGAQVSEYRSTMGKRAVFLKKLGTALKVIDIFSTACRAGGYLCEGDTIGATNAIVDKVLETGAASGGAAAMAPLGPAGSVVGAAAASELYQATISKKLEARADRLRAELLKNEKYGAQMYRQIFVGTYQTEESSGLVRVTVAGTSVRCFISGRYSESGRVAGNGGGTLGPNGTFRSTLTGTVSGGDAGHWESYAFSGGITGTVSKTTASGRIHGANSEDSETGTWSARLTSGP